MGIVGNILYYLYFTKKVKPLCIAEYARSFCLQKLIHVKLAVFYSDGIKNIVSALRAEESFCYLIEFFGRSDIRKLLREKRFSYEIGVCVGDFKICIVMRYTAFEHKFHRF